MSFSDNDDPLSPDPSDGEEIDEVEEGAPLWMTTFGDLMSLLLCFFILMFSMSEVKRDKFLLAADSFRAGVGSGNSRMKDSAGMGGESIVDTDVLTSNPAKMDITIAMDDVDDFMELISDTLELFVANSGLGDAVEVTLDTNGVTLSIEDVILFDVGSATLRRESLTLMRDLGKVAATLDMPVVVAGHTDDQPISTVVYPSNWELSAARASTVTRIILQQGLDPSRIHAEGYAEFQPAATNETWEGRASNRRVEILYTRQDVRAQMIEQKVQQLVEEPEAPPEGGDTALEVPPPG